jgi:phage/plasmid-like protein (TIGR03299 family)
MAHEITKRQDGSYEMAFTGPRSNIWHGLGSQLEDGASLDVWAREAGLDWTVLEKPLHFMENGQQFVFSGKKALVRSNNMFPLSVVSSEYNVVQPKDVLYFFKDLVGNFKFKLSTAGTLFDGKKFWALAETNKKSFVKAKNDEVNAYLLLMTSVDGSTATIAKFTSTRVVCNNTMRVALANGDDLSVKISHRSKFDPESVKLDLGVFEETWELYMDDLNALAEKQMSKIEVINFFETLHFPNKEAANFKEPQRRVISELDDLYENGAGANLCKGTAWGALNAVTNYHTFGSKNSRKSLSSQFCESYIGKSANVKTQAMKMLLAA